MTDTKKSSPPTISCLDPRPTEQIHQNAGNGPMTAAGFAANGSTIGGGFAATPNAAGNTKKEGSTSPLSAALVLKANFIELLPKASRPFLTPLAESALREFASYFYAEEKAKETKSDPN